MTSVHTITKDGPAEPPNYSGNGEEAGLLCERIRRYWVRKGFKNVEVHPHHFGKVRGHSLWGTRSNLIGGWPPRENG